MEQQSFDLIIRGHAFDPLQGLDAPRDIGIRDGRIAAIEPSLQGHSAREHLDATGSFVTPGFVDTHAHIYAGVCSWGAKADPACLRSGVTTVVDAGSAGWTMLQGFRWYISEPAKVRALCFLHISGIGLLNAWVGDCRDLSHLHPRTVGENVAENRDLVVGIKVRQGISQVGTHGTRPLELALEAARIASIADFGLRIADLGPSTQSPIRNPHSAINDQSAIRNPKSEIPVMCHIADGIPLAHVLELLRPGDIVTHCFQGKGGEGENLVDSHGKLLPEVVDARQKGVIMDVGHGGGSFRWGVAEAALQQGFLPDVISTDLHAYNLHGPLFDMATTLTKFLYLGVPLEKVIEAATAAPARAIGRPDLGALRVGAPADLAVFRIVDEPIELWDTHLVKRDWNRRLRVEATVCGGHVYRPEEWEPETEDEITKRCRLRGNAGMLESWKAQRERLERS